jgi:hypothetical protein
MRAITQIKSEVGSALQDRWHRHVYERPSGRYRRHLAAAILDDRFSECSGKLVDDGVLILPAYFDAPAVQAMQQDFAAAIKDVPLTDKDFAPLPKEVLSRSVAIALVAVDPFLTSLISYYWGKDILLAGFSGSRIEPSRAEEYGAFQWHHDTKRKQVKIMLLLSEVAPVGQRMDYIPGTHPIYHRFSGYEDTRFTSDYVRRFREPVRCAGPAGTVILFDTNGIHRGNRNAGARRDVCIFNYTAGHALCPLPPFHPELIRKLTPEQRRILRLSGR